MPTHTIRLRGAWVVENVEAGRVRVTRRFGKPRTLDANENVWLVGVAPASGSVAVNGHMLGTVTAGQAFALDITSHLQLRNEVALELETLAVMPVEEIALEIRS